MAFMQHSTAMARKRLFCISYSREAGTKHALFCALRIRTVARAAFSLFAWTHWQLKRNNV